MTRHYTDVGDEATALAITALPSMLGGGKTDKPTVPASATSATLAIADVSGLADADLGRLTKTIAAEMARRGKSQ
jgi:hypothetical protein